MKEATREAGPWEFGEKPVRRNNAHDWAEVRDQAIKGDFTSIAPEVLIKHYPNLRAIHKDLAPKAQ